MPLHDTDFFINESRSSQQGYWEPHSASIDFCESNYVLTYWIAEPHNVFSSLWGIVLLGIVSLWYGNPTGELRFVVLYSTMILVGLGSAALHTTFHWTLQSADELPMLYYVICGIYQCVEMDSPRKHQIKYPRLPWYLAGLAMVDTIVYYQFQSIYVLFLLSLLLLLLTIVYFHSRLALQHRRKLHNNQNSAIAWKYYIWHYYVLVAVAFPIWIVDQFCCSSLLPYYDALPWPWTGCTLHIIWHSLAGLGVHYLSIFFVACRLDALGHRARVYHLGCGLIPVCTLDSSTATEEVPCGENGGAKKEL